ncbi:hypothetical protein AAG747_20825 [Rapidithrix thailandica]|uniref:PCI domain-containing protein n=1 Tax=Rapidithrix thailandica TaxID=413964 RepID=A0AAW9S5C6_9BACT
MTRSYLPPNDHQSEQKGCLGILLIGLGLLVLPGFLHSLFHNSLEPFWEDFLQLSLFGLGPMFFGFRMYIKSQWQKKLEQERLIENQLIRLATSQHGLLTVVDVMLTLKITSAEAKKVLEDLHTKGVVNIDLAEEVIIYRLNDYLTKKEKDRFINEEKKGLYSTGDG